MRPASLAALLALALVLGAPMVAAATVNVTIVATDDGLTSPSATGLSPTIRIAPGSHVVVTFEDQATTAAYSLRIGAPVDRASPCCQHPGDRAVLTFDVAPDASGQIPFWSEQAPDTHRGVFQIEETLATIQLTQPADGATVGATVTARAAVDGETAPQVVWAFDGVNVTNATTLLTQAFDVPQGHHLVHVELVDASGSYRSPRVFAEAVVFRGRDALETPPDANATSTTPTATTPANTPGVGLLGLVVAASVVAIASPCRRPR